MQNIQPYEYEEFRTTPAENATGDEGFVKYEDNDATGVELAGVTEVGFHSPEDFGDGLTEVSRPSRNFVTRPVAGEVTENSESLFGSHASVGNAIPKTGAPVDIPSQRSLPWR